MMIPYLQNLLLLGCFVCESNYSSPYTNRCKDIVERYNNPYYRSYNRLHSHYTNRYNHDTHYNCYKNHYKNRYIVLKLAMGEIEPFHYIYFR